MREDYYMQKILTFLVIGLCVSFLSAQTNITVPDTITSAGHYLVDPAGGTFQIDTTGVGFIRAALWIAGQDTDSYNQNVPGVNDVFIDGQGATIIGYGSEDEHLTATEFGVWFQNDLRALPSELQDTTYRDTCINVSVQNFKYGVAFRQVADGLIDNCTIDSTQKGIELMSTNFNVRNTITNNVITNSSDKGISVRGSYNLFEKNTITNADPEYGKYGIQIDRDYSEGNRLFNNTISGGTEAGIRFIGPNNTTDGNAISNAQRGIYISGSSSKNNHDNLLQNDQVSNCEYGLYFIYSRDDYVTGATLVNNDIGIIARNADAIVIENSSISGSDSLDVIAEDNSVIFLYNTEFDTAKVLVEAGSIVFTCGRCDVDLTITKNGEALSVAADVVVTNTSGDTVAALLSDTTGAASLSLGEWAILPNTPPGSVSAQNPYTFKVTLEDGSEILTATVTSDTSFTIDVEVVGIEGISNKIPNTYALHQNYPNPFNPETIIKYQLPKISDVELKVYNLLGQVVATLLNEKQSAGYKSVVWDGTNQYGSKVSSGMYFYVLKAGEFRSVKKMMLLK